MTEGSVRGLIDPPEGVGTYFSKKGTNAPSVTDSVRGSLCFCERKLYNGAEY